jgi:glycerol kinase
LGISTGLPLSPHYVGPKLAFLFETDKQLRTQAANGDLAFGTLETFCLYHWSREKEHSTDLSMAARTMLADPVKGVWSDALLSFFGVPVQLLPEITPTYGKGSLLMQGGEVTATMADQAAAGVSELNGHKTEVTMINLGTGGFVIVPTGGQMQNVEGYLAGPLYKSPEGDIGYAVEGTVNGIARALTGFHDMQMPASPANLHPDLFCLPETAGLGSPYWVPDFPAVCSKTAASLSREALLTVVLEGIVFRLCQIVKELHGVNQSQAIVLSGGMANNKFISQGIADCLGQPVYVSKENEATLAGVGRLAAGRIHTDPDPGRYVCPAEEENHLARKFNDWQEWADRCVKLFQEGGEKLLATYVKCRFLP